MSQIIAGAQIGNTQQERLRIWTRPLPKLSEIFPSPNFTLHCDGVSYREVLFSLCPLDKHLSACQCLSTFAPVSSSSPSSSVIPSPLHLRYSAIAAKWQLLSNWPTNAGHSEHHWYDSLSLPLVFLSLSDRTWSLLMSPTRGVYGKTKALLQPR